MDFQVSDRMSKMTSSIIWEILKLASDPSVVSFGGGNPAFAAFPVKEIERISSEAFKNIPASMLLYGSSEGYTPLREALKVRLSSKRGVNFETNDIMIMSGAQQAADLMAKVLVNEGDTVISEDPSFMGCLNAFRSYNANMVGVPMESDGMNMELLEKALIANPNTKIIYVIPNFQNPTGFTTCLEKRKAIYALAQKYNVAIFEDDPYADLRFEGEELPTIKSMDVDGRVFYAGSFSKIMAPAFRVGFVCFDKSILQKMVAGKQCTDVHTTLIFQHICAEFMTNCDYEGHINSICKLYKQKADLMLSELAKNLHPDVKFGRPEGGMFLMAFLPEGMDAFPMVEEGLRRGVACIPGSTFGVDDAIPTNSIRINYSSSSDSDIIKGAEILGKLTYDWLAKK